MAEGLLGLPGTLDLGGKTYRVLREVPTGAVLMDPEGTTYILPFDPTTGTKTVLMDPAKLRRLGSSPVAA